MTDTATILRKARDHIAQPGMWWQGGWSRSGISGAAQGLPCCAAGALAWALGADQFTDEVDNLMRVLESLIASAHDDDFAGLGDWNDEPGRTQTEVVALFDRAIELAEKEGAS